jgi:hypothetical protein
MNPNNTHLENSVAPESGGVPHRPTGKVTMDMNPLLQAMAAAPQTNPLLAKVKVPGKIFQLPSKGLLYDNGELRPGVENGEIHVYPMSAIDEIKMKNPDMLFSGRAFEEVIRNCVPDVLKPAELFGRDVDAIMTFLRITTYGNEFAIETRHTCEHAKDREYAIDLNDVVAQMKPMEPALIETYYTVTLPNEQVVLLEPIRLKHVVAMLQSSMVNKDKPTIEDIQSALVDQLLNMIRSVDGISDRALIAEWVSSIPSPYVSTIADRLTAANEWGPLFDREVKCRDCGEDFLVELPVNPVSFFTA